MSTNSSWFQRFLLPGFAFKAVVIGGGYATGRELAEFFLPSGPKGGLAAMVLAMLIWSAVCAATFAFATARGALDYRRFFQGLLGPFWRIFELSNLLMVVLVLSVFGAAAGAIGAALFGWPLLAGTLCLTAAIAGFAAFGARAVEPLFKYVTFFLYGTYGVFFVLSLSRFGSQSLAALSQPVPMTGWIEGGVSYSGYNLIGAVAVLPVLRHLTGRRDALIAGCLAGPLAMLPALLFFFCMIGFFPEIENEVLPSDFLLAQLDLPIFRVLFQLMIFSALLESGTGIVHAINERIAHSTPGGFSIRARAGVTLVLLTIAIFFADRFGLVRLIAEGYRGLSYLMIAIYVVPLMTYGLWRLNKGRGSPMRLLAVLASLIAAVSLGSGAASAAPALTTDDVNAWLDGYMPYAMKIGDIPGAVVVVVKDGQILTERGYGFADVKTQKPVDPERTLFRPGSVSKLFTWTAIMQLVEQGKLDLDKDVNTYLDFTIPSYEGKPVTMRNIMSHAGGFEEAVKHLFSANPEMMTSLGDYVKSNMPNRIYPPGEVSAYSNWATAVAGYVIERLSGEKFADYIQNHILTPIGMLHATFVQPLPEALKGDMATGYVSGNPKPRDFELVNGAPAGSLSATGADMGRFMIAHLQNGTLGSAQILKPETAKLMHTEQWKPLPNLAGMALGFYHTDRNGHEIIGHGGDTTAFHSDLQLFLNDGVGLFVSVNSSGRQGAAGPLRGELFRQFTDRYFPAPEAAAVPTADSAKADGAKMVGTYVSSRRGNSSFLRLVYMVGAGKLTLTPDGEIMFSEIKTPGQQVRKWREIGPFLWQEVNGRARLSAKLQDGKVVGFTEDELPPVLEFQPAPPSLNGSWNLPLLYCALGVLILAVVAWPIAALARRHYGKPFPLSGEAARLFRWTRIAAVIDLMAAGGWLALISLLGGRIDLLNDPLDPWLRLVQFLTLLGCIGAIAAVWNAVTVWGGDRGWWARISATAVALACVSIIWFTFALDLITLTTRF